MQLERNRMVSRFVASNAQLRVSEADLPPSTGNTTSSSPTRNGNSPAENGHENSKSPNRRRISPSSISNTLKALHSRPTPPMARSANDPPNATIAINTKKKDTNGQIGIETDTETDSLFDPNGCEPVDCYICLDRVPDEESS